MNTIKIKLSTSGRIAALDKNFPLYRGQFQDTLLKIYVPTAILSGGFEVGQCVNTLNPAVSGDRTQLDAYLSAFIKDFTGDETRPHTNDVVFYIFDNSGTMVYYRAVYNGTQWDFTQVNYFEFGDAGANVKIGMVGTQTNGVVFKSEAYYTRYIRKFVIENEEYALYERKLPRDFTAYTGEQNLVINVTNVQFVGQDSKVTNIVTTQIATLEILPSTVLDGDEPIEASDLESLEAAMNALVADMEKKQDKQDNEIEFTVGKTVVGALNDLNARELSDRADLDDVMEQADENSAEIAKIKDGTTVVPEARTATYDSAGNNIANKFAGYEDGSIKVKNAQNADNAEIAEKDTAGNNIAATFAGIRNGTIKVASAAHADAADVATKDSVGGNIAEQFAEVTSEIAQLQAIIGTGEDFIGTLTIDYDPTLPANYAQLESDLTEFVDEQVDRAPKGGDSVIVVEEIEWQTDRNFKFIYTGTEWHGYEIPPAELAKNGSAGLVSGTYNVGSTNNTLVDIVEGEIRNIYIKDGNSYRNIVEFIGANKTAIENIINGTTVVGEAGKATNDGNGNSIAAQFANIVNGTTKVGAAAQADSADTATKDGSGNNIALQFSNIVDGTTKVGAAAAADTAESATKDSAGNNIASQFENIVDGTTQVGSAAYAAAALKATQDALGNNIVNTYLTKALGATKQYVKDYALPKEFNDVLYLTAGGFEENIPTTPASGIQFSATSSAIGETQLAQCDYELGDVEFQLARKNSYTARYYIEADTDTGETLQFKLNTYAVINNVEILLHSELTTPKIIPTTLSNFDFGEAFAELGNTVLEMKEGDKIRQKLYVVRENSNTVTFDVYSNSTYPSSFYLNTTLEVGVKMVRRASEEFTLYSNGWSANANIAPYAYSADLQLPFSLDENSYVELIVDAIIAAKYGFVIGAVNDDTVTFYAVEEPTEDIDLKLIIDNLGTLNTLEDNYAFGYTFYLRNGEVEQSNSNAEVE